VAFDGNTWMRLFPAVHPVPGSNVYLAPSPNPASHPEDVDGDVDVVFHFRTGATGIDQRDTEACLTGTTEHGVLITASDRVTVRRP
jgi:hypothetical protein